MRLPPRGIPVKDLKCSKCGKTMEECPPSECQDPDCPQKPKDNKDK